MLRSYLNRQHILRWMSYRRVHPRRRAFSIKSNLTSGYPNLIRDISIVSTTLASAVVVGHVFLTYFYTLESAWGVSMTPTLQSFDWLLISKYYRRGREVKVGDLVSFRHPVNRETYAVKRVIGMPGDFVLRDTPGKTEVMIQVPEGHCWVTGDNLLHSRDSRMFGPLPLALVLGKVLGGMRCSSVLDWGIVNCQQGLLPVEEELD